MHETGTTSVYWFNRLTKKKQDTSPDDWYKDERTGGKWECEWLRLQVE